MIFSLAVASLSRRPVRTSLTALGIAVAVASTVIFLSLGEGLRQAFVTELGSVGPDLQISYGNLGTGGFTAMPQLPLSYLDELLADADSYGIERITPVLVYLRAGLSVDSTMVFQGVPPGVPIDDLYLDFGVERGRSLNTADAQVGVAVIGAQVANRLGLGIGDEVRFNPRASYRVIGVARTSAGLLDNSVMVPLASLQTAIGVEDLVSTLMVDLRDPSRADAVAAALSEAYPELGVQTRGDLFSLFDRGMAISDMVRLGISFIALVMGAIAVANTMLMSVFERTREFGVVRAVGARPRFLFGLVLTESLALAMVGAAFGVLLGWVGVWSVNAVATDLIGLGVAALTPRLLAFAVLVAGGIGLLAGLLPAGRAAKTPIAVALARD